MNAEASYADAERRRLRSMTACSLNVGRSKRLHVYGDHAAITAATRRLERLTGALTRLAAAAQAAGIDTTEASHVLGDLREE